MVQGGGTIAHIATLLKTATGLLRQKATVRSTKRSDARLRQTKNVIALSTWVFMFQEFRN